MINNTKFRDIHANSKNYYPKESLRSGDDFSYDQLSKNENFSKSNVNKKLEHFNIDKSNLSINSQNLRRYTPDLVSDEDIIPELNYKYNK